MCHLIILKIIICLFICIIIILHYKDRSHFTTFNDVISYAHMCWLETNDHKTKQR